MRSRSHGDLRDEKEPVTVTVRRRRCGWTRALTHSHARRPGHIEGTEKGCERLRGLPRRAPCPAATVLALPASCSPAVSDGVSPVSGRGARSDLP